MTHLFLIFSVGCQRLDKCLCDSQCFIVVGCSHSCGLFPSLRHKLKMATVGIRSVVREVDFLQNKQLRRRLCKINRLHKRLIRLYSNSHHTLFLEQIKFRSLKRWKRCTKCQYALWFFSYNYAGVTFQ